MPNPVTDVLQCPQQVLLRKGGLTARLAQSGGDLHRAQVLRGQCFASHDAMHDALDETCLQVLIEDDHGALLGCFRLLPLRGADILRSYSAQFYDVRALTAFNGLMVEVGRFCLRPDDLRQADILRVAWGAITAYVDAQDVRLLFGCASFQGTDADRYRACFATLRQRHLAPVRWRPGIKARHVVRFGAGDEHRADAKLALRQTPPLLRTYLLMGGWVSDHAVVDHEMNTLHVFTGVEIAAIPAARKRLLRAVAG